MTAKANDHCGQLVREADKDRFLATLFAPAQHRAALFALYAFNGEIARVRDVAREPMPGEIRLQWWREVVEGIRTDEARAHPVAAALLEAIARYALPRQPLTDLIEAHTFDLYNDPMPSLQHADAYAAKTSGALFSLAARVLHGEDVSALLTRHCGMAYGLIEMLRQFPRHAARGQLYLPLDVLQRHGASENGIFAGKATPGLYAALAEMRLHVRGHLAAANDLLATAPTDALPAFLPIALVRPLLARVEQGDYDPFTGIEVPQWRRQWALWRAARKPHRMAGR